VWWWRRDESFSTPQGRAKSVFSLTEVDSGRLVEGENGSSQGGNP